MAMRDVNVRALIAEIVLPLLLLATAELGLRVYLSHPAASLFPQLFRAPLTTAKFLAYRRLDRQAEPLDILLMGMSEVGRLSAAELSQDIFDAVGVRVTVFNFGSPGHTVWYDRHLLEDVLVKIKRPRVIVYGLIPTNLILEPAPVHIASPGMLSPVFAAYGGTPAAALQRALLEHLDLMLYREALRSKLSGEETPEMRNWARDARKVSAGGDMAPPIYREPKPYLNAWERENLAKPMRDFDALIERSALFDSLAALARTCRRLDIQLVLLMNPVSPVYMEVLPNGADDYREFRRRVQEAAAAQGLPLLDPSPDGIASPDLFADTTHHNQAGITWMSHALAAFLIQRGLAGPPDTHAGAVNG